MTTQLATSTNQSVTERLAQQYGTEKSRFYKIVKATCRMEKATDEQFENFLLTAEMYKLNPLMKQMWAYPDRNGGIMTMVAIDGWIKIVNDRPEFDGYETTVELSPEGKPISASCIMWRKDRSRPTKKTVYLSEWFKDSSPVWKQMPIHFIEMRAFIQCARMCFNISGIYDADITPVELHFPDAVEVSKSTKSFAVAMGERSKSEANVINGVDQSTGEVLNIVHTQEDDNLIQEIMQLREIKRDELEKCDADEVAALDESISIGFDGTGTEKLKQTKTWLANIK